MSSAARYGLLAAVTSALLLACGDASGPADAGAPRLAGNILIGGDSAGVLGTWSIRPDGSGLRRVADVRPDLLVPAPDLSSVVLQSGRDVFRVEPGSSTAAWTHTLFEGSVVGWTGDAARLVYIRGGVDTDRAIYSSLPDGSGQTAHPLPLAGGVESAGLLPGTTAGLLVAAVLGPPFLHVAGLDGATPAPLASGPDGRPSAWAPSPDGRSVALAVPLGPDHVELWIVALDGSAERRLLVTSELEGAPPAFNAIHEVAWSPDGTRLAFVLDGDLWLVSRDGSELRKLDGDARVFDPPSWSGDGRRIAYARLRAGADFGFDRSLYVLAPDGDAEPERVTDLDDLHVFTVLWVP